ncbi:MAG TPA: tandem-95 repeat protein [Actinocrinis sp.]|nr:tandem-95 repeat protein [Actinocrinis sp.]
MIPWSRRRTQLATSVVLLGAVAALIASAVLAQGYPVQQVSLNDGGIWVTSDHDGLFGRLNKPAGQLDAGFYPPGTAQASYQLDVLQDGAAVAAWDQGSGKLYPVDVDNAVTDPDQAVAVPAADQAQLDGGTIATLDPGTGEVRAQSVDTAAGISNLSSLAAGTSPLATVGSKAGGTGAAGSAMAVGVDGTVYAVSGSGRTATIQPAASAISAVAFGAPQYGSVGRALGNVRVTAVGDQMIVLDDATGTLLITGGPTVHLDGVDSSAQLQMPSPQAASVVIATSHALLSVDLTSGHITVLWNSATGAPAAPVQLSGCVYAAWADTANGYVSSCNGIKATPGNLADKQALVHPEFRINRNQIVLNDLASGAVWDLSSLKEVDDWASVKPPPVQTPQNKNSNTQTDVGTQNQPPKAQDVTLGARPDRTTVLHLLDGCSDPGGNILSITALTQPDNQGASVAIAPDGQTALVTLSASSTGDVHFKYTVDDGKGMTASANVTVQIRGSGQNDAPNLRTGYKPVTWTVPSGGHISLPVLADWRDYDGDPPALSAVTVPAADGTAVATSDGFLDYTAPGAGNGGTRTITYQVADGHGGQTGTTVQVDVQSPTSTKAIAPTAEPNVARGQVGQSITVHPLQNAVPGFDPANPGAQLALAGQVASPADTTVTTDLSAGTVTMTATRPGTFLLDYTIAFGDAPFGKGTMRVDVVPAPATPQPPVAMPSVAVLHGQLPATVDVLANDYDPQGELLAVQGASAVATDDDPLSGQLQVAVVDGRWLRINATSAQVDPSPRLVRYTITDGQTDPVTGEVSVTELPATTDDTPVVVNSYATVRAGDSATIPVLDNDFDPDGAALTLASDIPGAPGAGQLKILSESGTSGAADGAAYVTGTTIRYVAPPAVTGPVTVIVQYVVENTLGNESTGQVFVTVNPVPSAAFPDRAPDPQAVQVRAVAGQTITIPIPVNGVDPDGDSVAVAGLASATSLGRVMSYNATTITYQAFPNSGGGTDSFGYVVEDPYGQTGTGTVQVAVVPPAAPQPPVAVDDTVTAAPGAHLAVKVLSQDIVSPGDLATVQPLGPLNPGLPAGSATLSPTAGIIDVLVPPATGKPLVLTYAVSDGTGDPSTATLTVFPQADYQTPPVALDSYQTPTPHATAVTVDVQPQLSDADSSQNPLTVGRAFDPQAQVSGGRLVLPVGPNPHTFAYEVRTPGGATTVGVVHVAGTGAGAPVAKPNTLITMPVNGSTTVTIGNYVTDPAGKTVRLTTTDKVWTAPAKDLSAQVDGEQQIKLTSSDGYVGPASLAFQVTDGTSLTDPAGHLAVITVQVQIGPQTPVLRCPTAPISLVEGGQPRAFDVTSVCYVWTADPGDAAGLAYTASWAGKQPTGVTVSGSGGHRLTITPGASSVPGSSGTLTIGVVGSPSASSQMSVQITAAAPPTVAPVTIDGIKAGQTATVNLAGSVSSQLYQPVVSVVAVSQTSGMAASVSSGGSTVRITPGAASHGVMTFSVTVTDVPSHTRKDRQTVGQITLNVLGVPAAPGQPTVGTTVLSQAVQLSWPTPANNGAPIDSYQVSYSGGQQTCPASPCTVTGLTNGVHYTFTVKAHNLVGWGQPSPASAVAIPNTIPDAVTNLTASDPQNGTVRLSWSPAVDRGTAVLHYSVSWTGGGQATVSGTGVTATGLDNDTQYTFTVIAVNAQGPSPATTVQGQAAGAPATPSAPRFSVVESADANSRAVTISWPAVDPNGPGPTTYTVNRTGGGAAKTVCSAKAQTSCDDDGLANNGTVYTYTVTAANADVSLDPAAHTSGTSAGTKMTATATPSSITNMTVTATGNSDQATVKFDAPASHGASSTVTCTDSNGSCGSWNFSTSGQNGVSENIGNLTDGATDTVRLQDCNGSAGGQDAGSACDTTVSATVVAYGPMQDPKVTASVSGTTVNWTVSVNPNGKAATATITHNGQTTTQMTSAVNGTWTYSGSDSMGYSATDKVTLSVAGSGRATVTATASATTGPKPSVAVSRGAACNTAAGSSDPCRGATSATPCTDASCGYIHIVTKGFTGTYTCTISAPSHGGTIGPALTFTGDQNTDTVYYYGYKNTEVEATCNGVTGTTTWP